MISTLPSLVIPYIDPVIVEFYGVKIHWYALAYILGILLGYFWIKKLNVVQYNVHIRSAKKFVILLNEKSLDSFITYAVLGIIIGGRLGFVLFYNLDYYLSHPLEIFAVWKGGMSFHGGLIGIILAFYGFSIYYKISYLHLMDLIACAAPIGLMFGRIANLINNELIGRQVRGDSIFGVLYPGQEVARYPSQIFEAFFEGLVLFIILNFLAFFTRILVNRGALSGLFLILYAAFRFFLEYFREPDANLGFVYMNFTMGQILCIPMIIIGVFIYSVATINGKKNSVNYRWSNKNWR
jgi:phosphatidylglycerol:prolipoprotein diacylglycerol transferase